MKIFGILGLFILIAIILINSVSFLLLIIPRFGLQFLILKCPKCNNRGGLKKTWAFSTEKESDSGNNTDVIDIEMVTEKEKVLRCENCDHKISI